MVNSGESNHEHFEELCALAALGQIAEGEFAELQTHLSACASCRARYSDFSEILHEHLPLLDTQGEGFARSSNIAFHDSSYKQRFVERARQEGIRFSDEVLGRRKGTPEGLWGWLEGFSGDLIPLKYAYSVSLLILFLVMGGMGYKLRQSHLINANSSSQLAKLNDENTSLRQRVHELSESKPTPSTQTILQEPQAVSIKKESSADNSSLISLQAELSRVRQDYAVTMAKSQTLDEQLKKASTEAASLRAELETARSKTSGAEKLRATEQTLQRTLEELTKLRQERSTEAQTIAMQQAQIRELTDKLNGQTEAVERERELLVAGRDIRDLMGARNLHIIDVADVDSKGTKRPFGRVFYTEGKSLIFYAYDLEKKKKSQEKYSFQAWGQRESKAGSAQSLGVFFADDRNQNRWVLKYDDPSVLAQIDSVFVTIEPSGGSMRPRGEQLLYAYLKANPNHP